MNLIPEQRDIRTRALAEARARGLSLEAAEQMEMSMRQRAFLTATTPWVLMKTNIVAAARVTWWQSADGELRAACAGLSATAQRCLDLIDEFIAAEARRYGVEE